MIIRRRKITIEIEHRTLRIDVSSADAPVVPAESHPTPEAAPVEIDAPGLPALPAKKETLR